MSLGGQASDHGDIGHNYVFMNPAYSAQQGGDLPGKLPQLHTNGMKWPLIKSLLSSSKVSDTKSALLIHWSRPHI